MNNIFLIFPHHLFEDSIVLKQKFDRVILIEEYLFFKAFNFHKQKLVFHRETMLQYQRYLLSHDINCEYISTEEKLNDIRIFVRELEANTTIHFYKPHDNWLQKRLEVHKKIKIYNSPSFISDPTFIEKYFQSKKAPYLHHDFYIKQRKNLDLLLEGKDQPVGGQWSFDKENRRKYPKNKQAPHVPFHTYDPNTKTDWQGLGSIGKHRYYPINFSEAKNWLNSFLKERFSEFGVYEDAIVSSENFLNHSILSPLINCGLLTPKYIVQKAILYADENKIPISSLEGFIRQIIGWREFILGLYEHKGSYSRNQNFWNHEHTMPKSCYDGTTGIPPVDDAIKKVLKSSYSHHIERLMILGNFFLLTEIQPNQVYKWFMEMYIDAYDWVMVPNVYGMSQFADGGIFATKPYISGSNYIIKMSDYKKGEWSEIWDALFWRFMLKHESFFQKNFRMKMLLGNFQKREETVKDKLLSSAENFLIDFHKK